MHCCTECFSDRGLLKEIFPLNNAFEGDCSYCGSTAVMLLRPEQLRDHFENLLSIYLENTDGKILVEWLQSDWDMFPNLDVANSMRLLGDILDDANIVRRQYAPKIANNNTNLIDWSTFRCELMHKNRFFPDTEIDQIRLEALLFNVKIQVDEIPPFWFRSRTHDDKGLFDITEMGAPPERKSTHGRANPAGIPYLYVASDRETAISEIRPHTGEAINVAHFSLSAPMKFVDLRDPKKSVSPFLVSDENEIALLRRDIAFLEELGRELMRPVLPAAAAIDYIPSQYLCEFIKKCGYDGVVYRSSVGTGINLALFNPEKAIVSDVVEKHIVETVSITTVKNDI